MLSSFFQVSRKVCSVYIGSDAFGKNFHVMIMHAVQIKKKKNIPYSHTHDQVLRDSHKFIHKYVLSRRFKLFFNGVYSNVSKCFSTIRNYGMFLVTGIILIVSFLDHHNLYFEFTVKYVRNAFNYKNTRSLEPPRTQR